MSRNTDYGLGRIYAFDPRDRGYQLPIPAKMSRVISKIWNFARAPLNQGSTPMCVGYSTAAWLVAAPVTNPLPDPQAVYRCAQRNDEWPGESYDGTSIRGAMKCLQGKGVVRNYYWSTNLTTVANFVLEQAPMVVGTNWYRSMFSPDANGNLRISGPIDGGHAYVLLGADQRHVNRNGSLGAFQILNSWGAGWGKNGRAWISFADMTRLLRESGEAAMATEIKEVSPVKFLPAAA